MKKDIKVNGLEKEVIDCVEELRAKAESTCPFTMLKAESFQLESENTFKAYKRAVYDYHYMLYNNGDKKYNGTHYNKALKIMLSYIISDENTIDSIVKQWGSHYNLVSAKTGNILTDKAKARIATIRSLKKEIELDESLTFEEKAEKFAELDEKIDSAKEYRSEFIASVSDTQFRKAIEHHTANILCGLKSRMDMQDYDTREKTAKWVRLTRNARKWGMAEEDIKAFVEKDDADGIKKATKALREKAEKAILEKAKEAGKAEAEEVTEKATKKVA